MNFEKILKQPDNKRPLIQCITNFVTVNDCANIILASNSTPTMADDKSEVVDIVQNAGALVLNMGVIDKVEAMILAGKKANEMNIPVILDPVAASASKLRRDVLKTLLENIHFSVIRGNASEISHIYGKSTDASGVDVSANDEITEDNLEDSIKMARELAQRLDTIIAISGKIDIVSNANKTVVIRNGCPTMSLITGSGCMLSSLIGSYCSHTDNYFDATFVSMIVMSVSGELADEKRLKNKTGNSTFRNDIIDNVFNITEEMIIERANYEIYKR